MVPLSTLVVSLTLSASGADFSAAGIVKIVGLLLLPFVAGHLLRPWLLPLVQDRPRLTTAVDKGTILLAVYGAFSAASVERLWSRIPPAALAAVIALCLVLLGLVLLAAAAVGRAGFGPENRAAILFCGSVKSLASGVPMARILFAGPTAGLVIVPVMLFHTLQLIVCAWIAARLARTGSGEQAPGSA